MMSLSRMIPLGLVSLGLCISGCSTRPTLFGTPRSRSAGAGDAISSGGPKTDRTLVQERGKPAGRRGAKLGDATDHFVNQRVATIARPARYSERELAQVEVWWTENNGFHWRNAGHFEQGQTSFSLNVREDGDYGVRFVGPDEEPAQRVLAYPERIYHVDTVAPEVQALVDPERADYHVGDLVSIDWMVQDYQVEKHPVTIEVLRDRGDADNQAVEFQRDLPDEGTITYRIPPEALGGEITFRIEARDRAGNVGVTHTGALQVVEDPMAAALAKAEADVDTDASEIASADRDAVAVPDPETVSDVTVPIAKETPALVIGPILIPLVDTVQEVIAATGIESAHTAAKAQLARELEETNRAEATQLAKQLKTNAKLLASRVAKTVGAVIDDWAASVRTARIEELATPQTPEPVVAVAAVEADDAEVDNTTDAWMPDQEQAAQLPPTFAVAEQPVDKSAAEISSQETLVASAAQTEAEESDVDTGLPGSMFLEFGPRIVMAEDPFESEPAPALPPSDESTAVAISDTGDTNNPDNDTADVTQVDQHPQGAPSPAAANNEVADEVEDASPGRAAQRSSGLPFATAIARLPAIEPQMMGEGSASEAIPADDAATPASDVGESPAEASEPAAEEDANPQISAWASAERDADHEQQSGDENVARDLPDEDEQPVDTAVAVAADDVMNEQDETSTTIETVASADQTEDEEPFLPATSIESLTTVDPTRGNGLLVPLPATLEDGAPPTRVTAHPWRILGRQSGSAEKTIWTLPERRSDVRWRPVFADRSPADDPAPRGVTPPKLAGTTEELIDRKPSDEP